MPDPVAPRRPGPWAARGETVEAMAWLIYARLLIALVPFGRWRPRLGSPVPNQTLPGPVPPEARRLARVVERGALRLPLETKCLPRAMALQAMLRRRAIESQLAIAVLPGALRGGLDDLHAWVELGGEVLIGASDEPYRVLLRLERFGTQ